MKLSPMTCPKPRQRGGFTLIEVLIATMIMLIIVVAALSLYVKSSRTASDQQQYVQIQQDVRAAMFYLSRDIRMAGAGLSEGYRARAVEGVDNESQGGTVTPDRILLMGNLEEAMSLPIQSCSGSGTKVTFDDLSLEQFSYPDSYYIGKTVLIFPNASSACVGTAIREVTDVFHSPGGKNEGFLLASEKVRGTKLPWKLKDLCPDADWTGGTIMFGDVYEYWLDVSGNYPGLTAGENGYIGGGTEGVLYQTHNGVHNALAMNIEDLQVQFNGNFDGDNSGTMDGFTDWNSAWTEAQVATIRQIRLWVVGRTPTRFVSVAPGTAPGGSLYRHPAIANSPGAAADDGRKRFLLETTLSVRNMALSLYNRGMR